MSENPLVLSRAKFQAIFARDDFSGENRSPRELNAS